MNFLAHCLIPELAVAATHPDLIAGGFAGDFLKGPVPESFPAALALGIRLHRRIDAFSNQAPAIRTSCARFPPELRRFAPIFVDIVADHLLANAWQHFHPAPLGEFSAAAYAAIEPHVARLPEHGQRFYRHARSHDLFARYGETGTLERTIESVARRLGRPALAAPAVAAVAERRADLADDFASYFPELVVHARDWLHAQGYHEHEVD